MFKWIAPSVEIGVGAVVSDPAMIAWAKGVLVAWSKTDGSLQSLAMSYGLDPQDLTPVWTQRDGIELDLFTVWWNGSGKKPVLPTSPAVNGIAQAQLTDVHLTALTTWATQKGLSMPVPQPGAQPPAPGAQPPAPGAQPPAPGAQPPAPGAQPPAPGAQPPAPGAPQTAPAGWPSQLPWPPPQPPFWPAGVPWPPMGAAPGAPPQGWPAGTPWDLSKWLPPGWPTALPFPLPLPNWWQPSGSGTQPAPAEPPAAQQLPPAKEEPAKLPPAKEEPAKLPPAKTEAPAEVKSSITVPLIVGGIAVAGIAVIALMTRKSSTLMLSNPVRRVRFVDLGSSSSQRDTKAQFFVWVVGKPGEVYGPYRTLKSAKTFARIGATEGAHDRAVTRGRNPKNVVRYYQAGTGASLVH